MVPINNMVAPYRNELIYPQLAVYYLLAIGPGSSWSQLFKGQSNGKDRGKLYKQTPALLYGGLPNRVYLPHELVIVSSKERQMFLTED